MLTGGRTVRIGVTGLARAGKTAFLTSVAANLLALGAGRPVLPGLGKQMGRVQSIQIAPAGADRLPRFDYRRHLAALTADPPVWPERTSAAALLAFDVVLGRERFGLTLPSRRIRIEMLDYPGEWLLDLPLLQTPFADWSAGVLARLQTPAYAGIAKDFLAFSLSLPSAAPVHEELALAGHKLYVRTLQRLRDESRLALLQPGRFLMPAPGAAPGWMPFFPLAGQGGLTALLSERYDRYVDAVREDLADPMFGNLDRIVVLADLLTALHAGPVAFADASGALAAAAGALRWRRSWLDSVMALARFSLPPRVINRLAFAATKADHVAEGQRGNLTGLLRDAARGTGEGDVTTSYFAIAAVRCTEDFVWTLEGRPVSAVRGRRIGDERLGRSYPGEVPDRMPGPTFWDHPFLELPEFEPRRPPDGGRGGVPELGLDPLLGFLLEDVL